MVGNAKVTGTASSLPVGLLRGTLVSVGITVAGAALMSALILREILRETSVGYCAMGILLLASLAGSMAAMRSVKQKLAVVSLLTGLCYFLVLIGGNALFCRGNYEGSGVTGLVILAGVGSAILLGLRPKRSAHSSGRKIRVR